MNDAKFDMHCHLEGTASPGLIAELAASNGVALPEGLMDDDGRFVWSDFQGFLDAYDRASVCILTREDYTRVTYEYLKACAAEGGIYSEVFLSPDHAAMAGLDYALQLAGVLQGIEDAERDFGIIGRIIVTCVRHLGAEAAVEVARKAVGEPHPWVVGFGMGGAEDFRTAADFAPAFRLAAEAGLQCTAHAGEMAGADNVRDVIDQLPLARIGHGVRSIEDPALIDRVLDRDLTLEVCVGSNLAIGIYPGVAEHPLPRLIDAGCPVVLGSDDPPYFATTIGEEYRRLGRDFDLGAEVVDRINRTAIERAFCDALTRQRLMDRLSD